MRRSATPRRSNSVSVTIRPPTEPTPSTTRAISAILRAGASSFDRRPRGCRAGAGRSRARVTSRPRPRVSVERSGRSRRSTANPAVIIASLGSTSQTATSIPCSARREERAHVLRTVRRTEPVRLVPRRSGGARARAARRLAADAGETELGHALVAEPVDADLVAARPRPRGRGRDGSRPGRRA